MLNIFYNDFKIKRELDKLITIKQVKNNRIESMAFVGQLYSVLEQKNETFAHLWRQTMEQSGYDQWQYHNPAISDAIVSLYDKKNTISYIGNFYPEGTPAREGFDFIELKPTETVEIDVVADHKTGILADETIYDQVLKEANYTNQNYQYAYIVYDQTFDPFADENHVTIIYTF